MMFRISPNANALPKLPCLTMLTIAIPSIIERKNANSNPISSITIARKPPTVGRNDTSIHAAITNSTMDGPIRIIGIIMMITAATTIFSP